MDKETLLLIVLSELAILAVLITLAVTARRLYMNRKARVPTGKAKNKGKSRDGESPNNPVNTTSRIYQQCVLQQLELTRSYHQSLGTRTDIALDLDPMLPEPQRTVALRHA